MPSLITCPGCKHQLTLPADFVGQRVECPRCFVEFAAQPAPTPALDVGPPAPPSARSDPPMQTAFAPAGGAPVRFESRGVSYYCVLCGAKLLPTDQSCPCCGCPIQTLRGDKPSERRRPLRISQPINGFLPIVTAILIPAGLMLSLGIPITAEIFRRGPASFWFPFFFSVLSFAIEVSALIAGVIWLYQAWRAMSRGDEEFSPGLMVGLLFVPFFNLYWIFRAVPGLSATIHRETRALTPTRAFGAGWVPGLIACILALVPYMQPVAVCVFLAWMLIANHALHRLVRLHEERGIEQEDADDPDADLDD